MVAISALIQPCRIINIITKAIGRLGSIWGCQAFISIYQIYYQRFLKEPLTRRSLADLKPSFYVYHCIESEVNNITNRFVLWDNALFSFSRSFPGFPSFIDFFHVFLGFPPVFLSFHGCSKFLSIWVKSLTLVGNWNGMECSY